jgi:flagellar hook-basal body complex protein FliE
MISALSATSPLSPSLAPQRVPEAGQSRGFGAVLASAVDDLAAAQSQARTSATAWEKGETQDLSAVMIDQQVASLGFQLALNVRNRALSAYRDIMNMPV